MRSSGVREVVLGAECAGVAGLVGAGWAGLVGDGWAGCVAVWAGLAGALCTVGDLSLGIFQRTASFASRIYKRPARTAPTH